VVYRSSLQDLAAWSADGRDIGHYAVSARHEFALQQARSVSTNVTRVLRKLISSSSRRYL